MARHVRLGLGHLAVLSCAACGGPWSTLDPAGPAAASIATLWWILLAGATALLVLVGTLAAASFGEARRLRRVSPRTWLLGLGVGLPVVVLAALLAYNGVIEWRLSHREPPALTVHVEARQWQWLFEYGEAGGPVSVGVLHLPRGVPVDLHIRSRDVIHSVWVPRLAGKLDAIPGHVNVLRVVAATAGTYGGRCAEYCGPGHPGMRFEVRAHEPADFATWLRDAGGAR